MKTISNEELTKFIGEIDGITVRRSSNSQVKVYVDICGKEIEVISEARRSINLLKVTNGTETEEP